MKKTVLLLIAMLSACAPKDNGHWLGYVEGESVLIAPPQAGWITSLDVNRGDPVKAGQALFSLDATREIAARDNAEAAIAAAKEQEQQAQAQIAQARATQAQNQADVVQAQKELARQQDLVRIGGSPRRDLEAAQASYDGARARRSQAVAQEQQGLAAKRQAKAQANQAEANLMAAEFNLSQRSVTALVGGRVEDIFFRQGEYANAAVPVISVLPRQNVFVRFFIPETQVANLRLGTRVRIACDGCAPDLTAAVTFVANQSEYTPPVIYSLGNRERLVFKAEARLPGGLPLRPGVPVEVWPVEAPAPAPQSASAP